MQLVTFQSLTELNLKSAMCPILPNREIPLLFNLLKPTGYVMHQQV